MSFFQEASKYHKGIPLYYPRKICQSLPEYLICQGALSLPSNYNPDHTSISHTKEQYFNRAPNFIHSAPTCTIQNTSNSQEKAHLRTPFLKNSPQWLLLNVSYLFRNAKRESFSYLLLI